MSDKVSYARVALHLRRRRPAPQERALIFRVFHALLPPRKFRDVMSPLDSSDSDEDVIGTQSPPPMALKYL